MLSNMESNLEVIAEVLKWCLRHVKSLLNLDRIHGALAQLINVEKSISSH